MDCYTRCYFELVAVVVLQNLCTEQRKQKRFSLIYIYIYIYIYKLYGAGLAQSV
jgi:hypothetical protein